MLQEMKDIRQVPGEPYRRCFSDDFFDLFVWFSPSGSIIGFQLCYDKGPNEKALTWFRDSEFSHERVDDGESIPYHYKMTPILMPDGSFDKDTVLRKFKEASTEIDSTVADFVCTKIMGIRMIKRLVFLYDSTIQPWDITIQPWDMKFKAIQKHLTVLQAKGFKCELLDTKDMPEEELEHWRKEATSVAVLRHQQIRQFFGSLRQGGLPYLGKQVPALLVYEEGENVPVAIYPHSEKKGRAYTEYFIKGFLEELVEELVKDRPITV